MNGQERDTDPLKKEPTAKYQELIPARVCRAILLCKEECKKDKFNSHHKFWYASVDAVYDHSRKPLAAAGLDVRVQVARSEILETSDSAGRTKSWLMMELEIGFISEEGEIEMPVRRDIGEPLKGPQTFGSAMSYATKYWIRERLRVATGDQDSDAVGEVPAEEIPKDQKNIVRINAGLDLEVIPEPTDQQWSRSEKLHNMICEAITQSLIRRKTKLERQAVLNSPTIAKAYTFLPKEGRDRLEAIVTEGS